METMRFQIDIMPSVDPVLTPGFIRVLNSSQTGYKLCILRQAPREIFWIITQGLSPFIMQFSSPTFPPTAEGGGMEV